MLNEADHSARPVHGGTVCFTAKWRSRPILCGSRTVAALLRQQHVAFVAIVCCVNFYTVQWSVVNDRWSPVLICQPIETVTDWLHVVLVCRRRSEATWFVKTYSRSFCGFFGVVTVKTFTSANHTKFTWSSGHCLRSRLARFDSVCSWARLFRIMRE